MLPAGAPGALAPSEVESEGGGAPASASRSRCATCGPRTSPTLEHLLFHRCRMGLVLAVRGEVRRTSHKVQAESIRVDFPSLRGHARPSEPARAPPDRPSRWISLTALVSPQMTGKVEWQVGNARRGSVDQPGITPYHPLDGMRRRTPPSSCISRFDFRELELLLFHGACRHARARVGAAGACCGCPIEPGGFACAPPWLLWRGWHSRQGA